MEKDHSVKFGCTNYKKHNNNYMKNNVKNLDVLVTAGDHSATSIFGIDVH